MRLQRTFRRVAVYLGCLTIATAAFADTVKLKNGIVLEGEIISEDETQMTIAVGFAWGTITSHEVINKNDVAEVFRLTPEQRAQRNMDAAYAKLKSYRLDVKNSGTVSYYDQVINGVFLRFLERYPN